MRDWFESLQQRERTLVLAMAAVLAIAIVYFALYQPLQQRLAQAQKSLDREVKLLQWVETNGTKLARLGGSSYGGSQSNSNGSLDRIVNNTARQYGLTINRLQPQNSKLNVTLDKANFSSTLQWLELLQQQHGITIDSVDFRAESTPGLVRDRVLLVR